MQRSFSFTFDAVPTQVALSQAKTAVTEEPASSPAAVAPTASPFESGGPASLLRAEAKGPATTPGKPKTSDALSLYSVRTLSIPVDQSTLDPNKTVIMLRSKGGFKLTPLSAAAGTKLILLQRRFEATGNSFQKAMSESVLANMGMPMNAQHPLCSLLNQYGLELVLSQQALAGLKRIRREFNRLMIPFKFRVPAQFKDLQGADDDYVVGPFVPDAYRSEILRYEKRLGDLGLVDPNKDFHLYCYQGEDVTQLAVKRYAFINHDMGLGKTLIAGALLQMHGYERVLVIAPAPAIGSWQSGWRHELLRMGIPKDHIHVIEGPEDLPNDSLACKRAETFKPFQDKPHVYLVDYSTLSKERWQWAQYTCPNCNNPVGEKQQGRCTCTKKNLSCCPICFNKEFSTPAFDEDALKRDFTGRYCKRCKWVLKKRIVTGGRQAKAALIMGHILKRKAYGKTKHLLPAQHSVIDNLSIPEMVDQTRGMVNPDVQFKLDGYLSQKPVWKHIHHGMFKFLLMDESHMIKDNTTRRGNAIQMLRGLKRVYVMTGTMLTNYVSDSFWQLQRLCPAGLFPVDKQLLDFSAHKGMKKGEQNFLSKFEGTARGRSGHRVSTISKPSDFWGMMARFQLRRHDDDVEVGNQVHLPAVHFNTEFIEMDPYHKDLYRMKTGEFQADIRKKIAAVKGDKYAATLKVEDLAPINPADLRTKLQDLRQIAACPDQTGIYQNKDGTIKMTTKDARVLELVTDAVAKKEKTVVFCSWISQITRLKLFLEQQSIKVMVLDGRTSKWEKWEKIDEWRIEPEHQVLLASIEAMGTAINLTSLVPEEFKCRQVIFGSPEWAPNKMEQAWCRLYRIGQLDETNVHFLYHKDTIEEDMDDMLYQKRQTIAKAQDRVEIQREDTQTTLTYQEIAKRIINKFTQENVK